MLNPSVMIVAASHSVAEQLAKVLQEAGCRSVRATNIGEALRQTLEECPQLIVIDSASFPEECGQLVTDITASLPPNLLPLCLTIRLQQGVLFRGDTPDQYYPERQVAFDQLVQAIRAMLSNALVSDNHRIQCHGLSMDRARHVAQIDGRELPLTLTEFRILWMIASSPGYVRRREELAEATAGESAAAGSTNSSSTSSSGRHRTIDAHIKAIRQKLGSRSDLIQTVRGIGYRFKQPDEQKIS